MVLGDGTTGGHVIGHDDIDAVSFTGSAATCRRILDVAAPRGIRLKLELGGHNPALVFDDADLDAAAGHVVAGAMLSTGQKCTATRGGCWSPRRSTTRCSTAWWTAPRHFGSATRPPRPPTSGRWCPPTR